MGAGDHEHFLRHRTHLLGHVRRPSRGPFCPDDYALHAGFTDPVAGQYPGSRAVLHVCYCLGLWLRRGWDAVWHGVAGSLWRPPLWTGLCRPERLRYGGDGGRRFSGRLSLRHLPQLRHVLVGELCFWSDFLVYRHGSDVAERTCQSGPGGCRARLSRTSASPGASHSYRQRLTRWRQALPATVVPRSTAFCSPSICAWNWRKSTMAKQLITSEKLYPVYGPYSHAVRVGDMIFLHGTVGFDPQGRLPGATPGRADMVQQCEQTIANMATALELLGGGLQDVVKVRAFLPQHCRPAQPGQRSFDETFDDIYGRHFQPPRPARAALQQGLFQEDLLVEIEG